jgi:hypothetical protein
MCIVIDTNTFASVFNPESQRHDEFKPVLDWIIYGKGKIVYGGSKYKTELKKARRYFGLFSELRKCRKVIEVDQEAVDRIQWEIETKITHADFDDPHLVAIISVSGCRLICSDDETSHPFLKTKSLYPKNVRCPKIYRRSAHRNMLCERNIAGVCNPPVILGKVARDNLNL